MTEDERRRAVLFNDLTYAVAELDLYLPLDQREALRDALWSAGWRRDVQAGDVNDWPEGSRAVLLDCRLAGGCQAIGEACDVTPCTAALAPVLDDDPVEVEPVPRCSRATCPVACEVTPCREGRPRGDLDPEPVVELIEGRERMPLGWLFRPGQLGERDPLLGTRPGT